MRYNRKLGAAVVASALPNDVFSQDATARYDSEMQHLQASMKAAGADHVHKVIAHGADLQDSATFDV
jgi:hypothetical protein